MMQKRSERKQRSVTVGGVISHVGNICDIKTSIMYFIKKSSHMI